MKKIRNLIIFVILIIIIILFYLIRVLSKPDNDLDYLESYDYSVIDLEINYEVSKINNKKLFDNISKNIDIYTERVNNKENEKVYNMLNKKYIEQKNITKDNIFEFVTSPYMQKSIYEIYELPLTSTKSLFFAFEKNSNYSILIEQDLKNHTISFAEYGDLYNDYIKYGESKIPEITNIQKLVEMQTNIEQNEDNMYMEADDMYSVEKNFTNYINILKNNRYDLAYELLDKEYKTKKFNNVEEFKRYIENTNYNFDSMITTIEEQDDGSYIISDDNGKKYIFNNNIDSYTVLLDTYTIMIGNEKEEYKWYSDVEKIEYDMNKFIDMINNKDYDAAYKLSDKFLRGKNLISKAQFEEYIKQNFYNNSVVEIEEIRSEGSIYICEISIIDATRSDTTTKTMVLNIQK